MPVKRHFVAFEHRRQPLAPRAVFLSRLWRNGLLALAVLAAALAIGMAGYMWFGPMGLVAAFAHAAMILSGMGPLTQLDSTGGLLFEGVYALVCGFLIFGIAGLVLAPVMHRMLHRFHLADGDGEGREPRQRQNRGKAER